MEKTNENKTHWPWLVVIIVVAGLAGGLIWYMRDSATFDTPDIVYNQADLTSDSDGLADFQEGAAEPVVKLTSPQPNTVVTESLVVSGEAPGTWFFEATLQLELQDANGQVLAQSFGTAQDDWMTEDMVPFTGTIKTDPALLQKMAGSDGLLVVKADNPSGLLENMQVFALPVTF